MFLRDIQAKSGMVGNYETDTVILALCMYIIALCSVRN